MFQVFVRERNLLGTYDAGSITLSLNGREGKPVASGQFIKVWQTQDESRHLSFTFLVSEKKGVGHVEFDLDDFCLDPTQPRNQKLVRLRVQSQRSMFEQQGKKPAHLAIQEDEFDAMTIRFEFEDGKRIIH
jgi:hypothetical protein